MILYEIISYYRSGEKISHLYFMKATLKSCMDTSIYLFVFVLTYS